MTKYGDTSPVMNCAIAHGVPVDHGYAIADRMLHQRRGFWQDRADEWIAANMPSGDILAFRNDLKSVVLRARGM